MTAQAVQQFTRKKSKRAVKKSKLPVKKRAVKKSKRAVKKSKRPVKKRAVKKSKSAVKKRAVKKSKLPVKKRAVKKSKRPVKKRAVKKSKLPVKKRSVKKSNSGLSKIKLKKGELEGYKLSEPTVHRRRVLGGHVYKKGYLPVMKRVNVLSIFLRNSSPKLSKRAESDKNWLMKRHKMGGKDTRWVPRKADGDSFFK